MKPSKGFLQEFLFIVLLLILGTINYGWVFYPLLGDLWSVINGCILLGLIFVIIGIKLGRRLQLNSKPPSDNTEAI
jgi:hypothetical protein